MSDKPTVEVLVKHVHSLLERSTGFLEGYPKRVTLTRGEARALLAHIREMQELLTMASELSWAIGQDDVGKEWEELNDLEERLHKFHKSSWMHQPKDNGIDLTQLPKGKPTAYSEGGRAR